VGFFKYEVIQRSGSFFLVALVLFTLPHSAGPSELFFFFFGESPHPQRHVGFYFRLSTRFRRPHIPRFLSFVGCHPPNNTLPFLPFCVKPNKLAFRFPNFGPGSGFVPCTFFPLLCKAVAPQFGFFCLRLELPVCFLFPPFGPSLF